MSSGGFDFLKSSVSQLNLGYTLIPWTTIAIFVVGCFLVALYAALVLGNSNLRENVTSKRDVTLGLLLLGLVLIIFAIFLVISKYSSIVQKINKDIIQKGRKSIFIPDTPKEVTNRLVSEANVDEAIRKTITKSKQKIRNDEDEPEYSLAYDEPSRNDNVIDLEETVKSGSKEKGREKDTSFLDRLRQRERSRSLENIQPFGSFSFGRGMRQQPYGAQPFGAQPYGSQPYGAPQPQFVQPAGVPAYGYPPYQPAPQTSVIPIVFPSQQAPAANPPVMTQPMANPPEAPSVAEQRTFRVRKPKA